MASKLPVSLHFVVLIFASMSASISAEPQSANSFVAHVASYQSMEAARIGLEQLKLQIPALLKNASPHIHAVELSGSKGTWYRVQIGPATSLAAMEQLCRGIVAAGHNYCKPTTASALGHTAPGFAGDLLLKRLSDGKNMQVLQQIEFVDSQGRRWTVPPGTRTDGASIPEALWSAVGSPFTGSYVRAAVIHDQYVVSKHRSWMDTHDVFYEAMIADGTARKRAMLMWGAVYRFGPRWSKDESMCWGTCAGNDAIFVEDVTIHPHPSKRDFDSIVKFVSESGDLDRQQVKQFIESEAFTETGARWRGHVSRITNEGKSKGIELVNEEAPLNWMSIGGWQFSQHYYRVTNVVPTDKLNMHSCARLDCQTIAQIPANEKYIVRTGMCQGDWCPVRYKNSPGWVHRKYLVFDWEVSPQKQ